MFLGELTHPVKDLEGIGPSSARSLSSMGICGVAGLLRHYPVRYEDRSIHVPLMESSPGKPAVTVATVLRHDAIRWKRGTALKVVVEDESGQAALLCFGRNFLAGKLTPGKRIHLTGPFERRMGELQSAVFVFEDYSEEIEPAEFGHILPFYSLGGNLTQGLLRRAVRSALELYTRSLRDEVPSDIRREKGFPAKRQYLHDVHFPPDAVSGSLARQALIFEELFELQIAVYRRIASLPQGMSNTARWNEEPVNRLIGRLPFPLTPDQVTSLADIRRDITAGRSMSRLLQGEVGSGKTLVAFLAALGVIGGGGQAAFMAPTELLARQHADNAAGLLEPLGVQVAFLTGDVTGPSRQTLTRSLKNGDVDLVIGTHALFAGDVDFRDLRLAVIDEQHRFGVEQRRALTAKGVRVDVLALSATPIPRTLALTAFGDMDVSSIRTMPAGRMPVETHLARMGNETKVYDFVRRELEMGHRAYFVYPLIEESDKSSLKDAQNMYRNLSNGIFPDYPTALVHSRVAEDEKRRIMEAFRSGDIRVLVATSVVEVGVDVPEATCMVVEHAERFGLSALHQLRGRVGRGSARSYCFLVYAEPLSDEGRRRLLILKDIHDGFALAEEDLKMRGPGDMAGIRQSGFLKLTIADPVRDLGVLIDAREHARRVLEADPGLLNPDHRDLRDLLDFCPPFDENLVRTG